MRKGKFGKGPHFLCPVFYFLRKPIGSSDGKHQVSYIFLVKLFNLERHLLGCIDAAPFVKKNKMVFCFYLF